MTLPVAGTDLAVGAKITAAFLDALNDNSVITASGTVTFTPTAGVSSSQAVTFPVSRFATPPVVMVSLLVAGAGTISTYGIAVAPTAAGFSISLNRSAAVATTFWWFAILTP